MWPSPRPFQSTDAPGVAAVQVGNYQHDYAPFFPPGFWDGVTVEEQTGDWQAWLNEHPGDVLLVQPEGEAIAGYVLARLSPFHGTDAEVMALHVRPGSRGRGCGAALLRAALLALQARGAQSVGLSTLEAHTSRAWYERLGGQRGEPPTQTYGDHVVREVVFVWPELNALVERLEPATR
ncbi:GNAT family N-acetyltransferase [Deinococcus multiflagellatus]|uniref:GNAT family N-acetyltransferase n=1 Tax=Deinococcus multiflagellatus TaxID=1656887 RepID=A0ABW1ZNC6_9DEIO|nr:GNAT family N-acetyltransferase [Deinococcus multiflagellatus]MBZ9715954.1 GNAT family N-acetyltransferase [Deinococcus multiflagellatus]